MQLTELMFVEIESIEIVEEVYDVYDLNVDDNHNFFANGLLVHNCSELSLSAGDSCRLISVNLSNFVQNEYTMAPVFLGDVFAQCIVVATRLSDDLVDLEIEKLQNIIKVCDTDDERTLWNKLLSSAIRGRRCGLGVHGLADMLAKLTLKYDSEQARGIVDKIMEQFANITYETSAILAQERGFFPAYDPDKEWKGLVWHQFIERLNQKTKQLLSQHGRRNISLLTCAPTGSVSILSRCSSGIEPVFMNEYIRRRKLNHNETEIKEDFTDASGDRWQHFKVYHHTVAQWRQIFGQNELLPDYFVEANNINWLARVDMQATIQKWIDHSISSTINLPAGTKPEVVAEIYMRAYEKGCKGITVYVDGSRTGVLITKKEAGIHQKKLRPKCLDSDINHVTVLGEKWLVLVGKKDGKPYEVFGGKAEMIQVPKKHKEGKICKGGKKDERSIYDLIIGSGDDELIIKDIVDTFENSVYAAVTRMISLSLRSEVPVKEICEQLQKDHNNDFQGISRVMARVLKKYIPDNEVPTDKTCPECKQDTLRYQDGCSVCTNCSYSACS